MAHRPRPPELNEILKGAKSHVASRTGRAGQCFDSAIRVTDSICALQQAQTAIESGDLKSAKYLIKRAHASTSKIPQLKVSEAIQGQIRKSKEELQGLLAVKTAGLKSAPARIKSLAAQLIEVGADLSEACHFG